MTTSRWFLEDTGHAQSSGLAPMFPPEQGPLHIEGNVFYTSDQKPWQWRGFTLFLAPRRFFAGEVDELRHDLRQLRAWGANTIRTFGPLNWKETPDYDIEHFPTDRLDGFFGLVGEEGMRCEHVPFCYLWGTQAERRKYAQRNFDIMAAHPYVFCEGVNEPKVGGKPDPVDVFTGVDYRGVLTAYGYYPAGNEPLSGVKVADYGTTHTPRDSAWFRKARHAQELQMNRGVPIIDDEPAKAIEINDQPTTAKHPGYNYSGGKTNKDEFVYHHTVAALWTPGSTLHTEEGKWGDIPLPGSNQYEIVLAVSENVWKKIDASWQFGRYIGAHLSASPVDGKGFKINGQDIWTYASLHDEKVTKGPHKALAVRCAVSHPNAQNGWKEVDTWGPGKCIVQLVRY